MSLQIRYTAKFRKDCRLAARQQGNLDVIDAVIDALANGETLPETCHDHALTGNRAGHRECHVAPDWLLIYMTFNDILALELTPPPCPPLSSLRRPPGRDREAAAGLAAGVLSQARRGPARPLQEPGEVAPLSREDVHLPHPRRREAGVHGMGHRRLERSLRGESHTTGRLLRPEPEDEWGELQGRGEPERERRVVLPERASERAGGERLSRKAAQNGAHHLD